MEALIFLCIGGFIAAFVDSIVGGSGLISYDDRWVYRS